MHYYFPLIVKANFRASKILKIRQTFVPSLCWSVSIPSGAHLKVPSDRIELGGAYDVQGNEDHVDTFLEIFLSVNSR
jgi:hypothetical protein